MSFFKAFISSCLGAFVAIILIIVGCVVLITMSGGEEIEVKENSVLRLDLDGPIIETEREESLSALTAIGPNVERPIGLAQLRQTIQHAKDDSKIKGIYINLSSPGAGYTMVEEMRQALIDFRKSGKWVVVFSEGLSESGYYLASAADKVYLHPQGEVEFNGLAVDISFFKRMFDKLEIKPEVFRVGEFKSAVEPFILDKMSDANRLQLTEMINSIYDKVLTSVSESRNIPKANLKEIADKMLVRNAAEAQQYKLVDSLMYVDEVDQSIRKRVGIEADSKISFIKYTQYKKTFSTYSDSENEVAVLVAEGSILPGKAPAGQDVIGSDSFNKEITRLRENDRVKAVVLRINSPGGSSLAADAMWREIALTAKVKPVIASMSDYAASGGYYMAMACDTIVAQPHTITGSIGVFSVLYDASGLLTNKLGITSEELKTGEVGQLITFNRPLTELEKSIWQKRTDEVYETFTTKAAEGRNMTVESIKKVASGRVWTGTQGKERGLVDVVGTFDDAVNIAAKAAGVQSDFKLRFYPQYKPSLVEQFVNELQDDQEETLRQQLGSEYYLYEQWRRVKSYQGIQARLPFELNIH